MSRTLHLNSANTSGSGQQGFYKILRANRTSHPQVEQPLIWLRRQLEFQERAALALCQHYFRHKGEALLVARKSKRIAFVEFLDRHPRGLKLIDKGCLTLAQFGV